MVEFRVKVSWAGGHGCAPSPRPPKGLPHGIPGAGLAGSGSGTTRAEGLAGLAGGVAEVRPRGAGQRRGMLRPGCRAVGRCQVEEMALRLPLWSRSRDRGGQDRVHVQLRDNPPARPRLPPDVHGRDRASELRIYAFQDSAFIASGRRGHDSCAGAAKSCDDRATARCFSRSATVRSATTKAQVGTSTRLTDTVPKLTTRGRHGGPARPTRPRQQVHDPSRYTRGTWPVAGRRRSGAHQKNSRERSIGEVGNAVSRRTSRSADEPRAVGTSMGGPGELRALRQLTSWPRRRCTATHGRFRRTRGSCAPRPSSRSRQPARQASAACPPRSGLPRHELRLRCRRRRRRGRGRLEALTGKIAMPHREAGSITSNVIRSCRTARSARRPAPTDLADDRHDARTRVHIDEVRRFVDRDPRAVEYGLEPWWPS